jgi:glutamine synthetase
MRDENDPIRTGAMKLEPVLVTPIDRFANTAADIERVRLLLTSDTKVKVAGVDFDGILRGKIMSKDKFLSSLKGGLGMSSAIFGWDMHDVVYKKETTITSAANGYSDLIARVDLKSMKRLPFENDLAFFLLQFYIAGKPVCADGRGILSSLDEKLASSNVKAQAGGEFPNHTLVFLPACLCSLR